MKYSFAAETDVGTVKSVNQDSILVEHLEVNGKEVLFAVICDGMGGLSLGELASATVIKAARAWLFENIRTEVENTDMRVTGEKISLLLKEKNAEIGSFGKKKSLTLGTTFTGMLFIGDEYVIVHVGDTRVYGLGRELWQITTDQTFVHREIMRGNMTPEQAKTDSRRNVLLQCVGASPKIEPEIITGKAEAGAYLMCSDGFRHELNENEILSAAERRDTEVIRGKLKELTGMNKKRGESDNISALMVLVENK